MESFDTTKQNGKQLVNLESLKTKFVFFVFGFVLYAVASVLMVGAQDILSTTLLPTTMVLLGQTTPSIVTSIVCPFFFAKLKNTVKIAIVFVTYTSGLLLVSLVEDVGWKLVGACLVAVGDGVGDMTVLSLSAFYHQVVISAFLSGSGFAFVTVPLYYVGLTTVMCIPPKIALLGVTIVVPLMPLMYVIMDKKENAETDVMATEHSHIEYTRLRTHPDEEETRQPFPTLSMTDKLTLAWKNLPLIYFLAIGHLSKFLSFESVITVLAFPDAPFGPRNHYVFYTTTLFVGQFIGRSYAVILLSIKPTISPYTKHTSVFSTLLLAILMFLIFAAWYRFIPSVWIVMSIMFLVGLLEGVLMVNTFSVIGLGENENAKTKTEFSRAFVVSGIPLGMSAAAFLGLTTEKLLRDHCIHLISSPEYCLTRSSAPWNATMSCRMR